MKKYLVAALLLLSFNFISCNKTYHCECFGTIVDIEASSRSEAKKSCEGDNNQTGCTLQDGYY